MSMPSLDFFKSTPATEQLRVESEPPGADARTTQGQSCRTPCELSVTSGGEIAVSYSLNGYQPQTLQVRAEPSPDGAPRLQPNPVYAELQPMRPTPAKKKRAPAKKVAKKGTPPDQPPPTNPEPGSSYPWPDPQPR
jgi:hypothetical protein